MQDSAPPGTGRKQQVLKMTLLLRSSGYCRVAEDKCETLTFPRKSPGAALGCSFPSGSDPLFVRSVPGDPVSKSASSLTVLRAAGELSLPPRVQSAVEAQVVVFAKPVQGRSHKRKGI